MTDPHRWRLVITPRAERELKKLPRDDQARIRDALDHFIDDQSQGDRRKLRGHVRMNGAYVSETGGYASGPIPWRESSSFCECCREEASTRINVRAGA